MQMMEKIINVPIGILLKHMTPTELCSLLDAAINMGIIQGKKNAEAIAEMKKANISIESMGIN